MFSRAQSGGSIAPALERRQAPVEQELRLALMREMARMVSSSRPGGRLTDSMSVTKPCW
jgi:hypothetical protein